MSITLQNDVSLMMARRRVVSDDESRKALDLIIKTLNNYITAAEAAEAADAAAAADNAMKN